MIATAGGRPRRSGLRLSVPGLEWALDAPRLVGETLRAIPGVRDVSVDAFTGSIVVVYEPAAPARPTAPAQSVVPVVEMQLPARRPARRPTPRLTGIAEAVFAVALEFALHQTLGPLFRRR